MSTQDATRANGTRFRSQNDRVQPHVVKNDSAPEWGGRFTCVACWRHDITDLERHRKRDCDDWNALNRINNGFVRQFNAGMAPPHHTSPEILLGEHYRLVKGRFNLLPHHIMRYQTEDWGPYDPLEAPPGALVSWRGLSYHELLGRVLHSLPPSMKHAPRVCCCSRALLRSRNGTTSSYIHERHTHDELMDMKAIGNFVEAHPVVLNLFNGFPWHTTSLALAVPAIQPLHGEGDWVNISRGGGGPAGTGGFPNGIAGSNIIHYQGFRLAQNGIGNPAQFANLYQGRNGYDVARGQFTMPGTPHR